MAALAEAVQAQKSRRRIQRMKARDNRRTKRRGRDRLSGGRTKLGHPATRFDKRFAVVEPDAV